MKIFTIIFCFVCLSSFGQDDVIKNANAFLSLLNKNLTTKAQFDFDHNERFNWQFVPRDRTGVSLHDLNAEQKKAAFLLLQSSLSNQGYLKATGIIELEDILRQVEGRNEGDSYRDPKKYYFTF